MAALCDIVTMNFFFLRGFKWISCRFLNRMDYIKGSQWQQSQFQDCKQVVLILNRFKPRSKGDELSKEREQQKQSLNISIKLSLKIKYPPEMYRVIHKSLPPIAKSLLAITIILNFAHIIIYL